MNGADILTQSDYDYDGHQDRGTFLPFLQLRGARLFPLWARFHCGCPRRDLSRYDVSGAGIAFHPLRSLGLQREASRK
jgi:hypothetical protein